MNEIWLYSIASVIIVSLISLIGIVTLVLSVKRLKKILLFLVSFAAGALFAGAFVHLLPEAVEEYGLGVNIAVYTLIGIIVFFIIEKFIHWRHCHSQDHIHPFAYTNL
ncbi:ZIP family metal transporter, partial [Candidatus Woesearchaeota archaeon]|nr:ZIP family metal transporter [Candidatus Woesearchaeota archaeon]